LWKLADFGFTSAGVSTPVTSGNGRGTEGYRSPELLKDERPQYSNRSDIWALGCILHELATGRRVFQYDLQTALYYDPQGPLPELPMLISYENKAWQDLISYCLRQFLSKESDERPNAGLASRRLALVAIYCTFLDSVKPQDMELLSSALFSPQYVVQPGLSLVERLLQLGKRYSMDGSDGVEGVLMKIITSRLKQNQQSMLLWFKHFTFLRTIGETLVGKQEHEVANLIFTGLVQNSPESVYTSVTSAAIHGDIFSMNILLSRGADVKQRSANGWQPLHWAAWNGHEKVVEILLQHNVDVDKPDPILGKTALHLAAWKGHEKVVEQLLQHKADVDKEHQGAGKTALHWAAYKGNDRVIEILLQHKANVDKQDSAGCTALHWAAWNGHEKVVKILLQHNADVDKQEGMGKTALHEAAFKGHDKVIELLLQHKADVDKQDSAGCTALHLAALDCHLKVIEILLRHKADVDKQGRMGKTALHLVAWSGRKEVIKMLLQNNANVDKRDSFGRTALGVARENLHDGLVDILRQHKRNLAVSFHIGRGL